MEPPSVHINYDTLAAENKWVDIDGVPTATIPVDHVSSFIAGEQDRCNGCSFFKLRSRPIGGLTTPKSTLWEATWNCHCGPSNECTPEAIAAAAAAEAAEDRKPKLRSVGKSIKVGCMAQIIVKVTHADPSVAILRYTQLQHNGHDVDAEMDAYLPDQARSVPFVFFFAIWVLHRQVSVSSPITLVDARVQAARFLFLSKVPPEGVKAAQNMRRRLQQTPSTRRSRTSSGGCCYAIRPWELLKYKRLGGLLFSGRRG